MPLHALCKDATAGELHGVCRTCMLRPAVRKDPHPLSFDPDRKESSPLCLTNTQGFLVAESAPHAWLCSLRVCRAICEL